MYNCIQANLHNSRGAEDMLHNFAYETENHVQLISEFPLRDRSRVPHWYTDDSGTAAILIRGSAQTSVVDHGQGDCYVWVKCGDVTFISCYLSPNDRMAAYKRKLTRIERTIRGASGNVILAGDMNARAVDWGMPETNPRGNQILELAAGNNLVVLNSGNTPTYERPGWGWSIPDVTLASEGLVPRVEGWKVSDTETSSDHNFITFQVQKHPEIRTPYKRRPLGWNVKKMDEEKFMEYLRDKSSSIPAWHGEQAGPREAEAFVKKVTELLRDACDYSMPRKRLWKGKGAAYWWTPEIAELRRRCHRARRLAMRARNRPEALGLNQVYKVWKRRMAKAIRQSKARCFRSLGEDVNNDPWGLGYKIVTGKLNSRPSEMLDAQTTEVIVDTLFPDHPDNQHPVLEVRRDEIPLFTEAEMAEAIRSMKNGKAPGPDGIPAEALKVALKVIPGILLDMFNACLVLGVFPKTWKEARLVLLSKGKGAPGSPSSYRPLCMLSTIGKAMEKMLRKWLRLAMEAAGGLSKHQHGFREGRSTVGAVQSVVDIVLDARKKAHGVRPDVLLVTLDVKNAFNSAGWSDIMRPLDQDFHIPRYLSNILRDYLRERNLQYDTLDGRRHKTLTAGIAQGSVLGPDLWNAFYDGLLRLRFPQGVSLIGYADDVALAISARGSELAQQRLNVVMRLIHSWMEEHGLQLAIPKTEIVLLTRRRIPTAIDIQFDDRGSPHTIQTKTSVKYLGVLLDNKLTFREHFARSCQKAAEVTRSLTRLMANVGGPRSGRRRLLMSAVNSILLYGSEVWADVVRMRKYRQMITAVQRRGALRIACAYQTVSTLAIQVVAGVIPIDLMAAERKAIYINRSAVSRDVAAAQARIETMENWQKRWEAMPEGRWTHWLIPNVQEWMGRTHGEVDFYLTQFLTGHGYFRKKLSEWGKVNNAWCIHCGPGVVDDVLHTFFECRQYREGRPPLNPWRPENVVREMLRSAENWYSVAEYVRATLISKREDGFLEDKIFL